jgi:uncharacterized protein
MAGIGGLLRRHRSFRTLWTARAVSWAIAATLAFQAIRGLGLAAKDAPAATMIQRAVPRRLQGRAFSNFYGAIGLAAGLSYVLGGVLLHAAGPRVYPQRLAAYGVDFARDRLMGGEAVNLDEIRALGSRLAELCRKYGIAELAVFGSVARGDAGPDSDVDLLYVRVPGNDLGMAYFDLQEDLERLFGRRVDLVAKDGLHRVIRDQVLADAQVLYAA